MRRFQKQRNGKGNTLVTVTRLNGEKIRIDSTSLKDWATHHGVGPDGNPVNSLESKIVGKTILVRKCGNTQRPVAYNFDEFFVMAQQILSPQKKIGAETP